MSQKRSIDWPNKLKEVVEGCPDKLYSRKRTIDRLNMHYYRKAYENYAEKELLRRYLSWFIALNVVQIMTKVHSTALNAEPRSIPREEGGADPRNMRNGKLSVSDCPVEV